MLYEGERMNKIPLAVALIVGLAFSIGCSKKKGPDGKKTKKESASACTDFKSCKAECDKRIAVSCRKLGDYYLGAPQMATGRRSKNNAILAHMKACHGGDDDGCGKFAYLMKEKTVEAFTRAKALCDKGNALGCMTVAAVYNYGQKYNNGGTIAKDKAKSAAMLKKLCDKGYLPGCGLLATNLYFSFKKDKQVKALALLKSTCDKGHLDSCRYHLAFSGRKKTEPAKYLALLKKICDTGSLGFDGPSVACRDEGNLLYQSMITQLVAAKKKHGSVASTNAALRANPAFTALRMRIKLVWTRACAMGESGACSKLKKEKPWLRSKW